MREYLIPFFLGTVRMRDRAFLGLVSVALALAILLVVTIWQLERGARPAGQSLTLYVALTGSDASDGSAARPWRHLDTAVSRLRPGDRLCVGAGVWTDSRDVIDTQTNTIPSGTDLGAGAITIGACNGDVATLKPPAGLTAVRLTYGAGGTPHHLVITDLSFDGSLQQENPSSPDGSPELLYTSSGAHHIRFQRLHVAHTLSHAVQLAGTNADPNTDTAIEFLDSVLEDIGNAKGDSGHGGPGINNGYAIYVWTAGARIRGNTFRDNRGTALVVYGPRNIIDGNLFTKNATRGGAGAYAVNFGSSSHPVPTGGAFVNNQVIDHPGGGVQVYTGASAIIANNTFAKNPQWAIHLQYCTAAIVANNIAQNAATDVINDSPGSCQLQLASNLPSATDARFVDAAAGDYRITADSPAWNAGLTLAQVATDFAGTPRPQAGAYDMGAFEAIASTPPAGVNYRITADVTFAPDGTIQFSGTGVPATR